MSTKAVVIIWGLAVWVLVLVFGALTLRNLYEMRQEIKSECGVAKVVESETVGVGISDVGDQPVLTAKREAAQTLSGVEVKVTPEIQKVIDKCLDARGVVDGVGANGVICTLAY